MTDFNITFQVLDFKMLKAETVKQNKTILQTDCNIS